MQQAFLAQHWQHAIHSIDSNIVIRQFFVVASHTCSHALPTDMNSSDIIQIVTGIEVNSESNFPKLREYCPSAEGTRAIFPQLREIRLTIDR